MNTKETFEYYQKLMNEDFLMTFDEIKNNGSLFNSYTTNVDDWTLKHKNEKMSETIKMTENKIKTINIPNATIKRHSHIGSNHNK